MLYLFVLETQWNTNSMGLQHVITSLDCPQHLGAFGRHVHENLGILYKKKNDPSYSLRKKYWCYVWKLLDVAVSDYQRLWNPHFQFNSSLVFMHLLVFLMSPLCLSTLGSALWHWELLGWMLFLHLCFGVSHAPLRGSFRLIHNIIYTFMYKPTLSPHIK